MSNEVHTVNPLKELEKTWMNRKRKGIIVERKCFDYELYTTMTAVFNLCRWKVELLSSAIACVCMWFQVFSSMHIMAISVKIIIIMWRVRCRTTFTRAFLIWSILIRIECASWLAHGTEMLFSFVCARFHWSTWRQQLFLFFLHKNHTQ